MELLILVLSEGCASEVCTIRQLLTHASNLNSTSPNGGPILRTLDMSYSTNSVKDTSIRSMSFGGLQETHWH